MHRFRWTVWRRILFGFFILIAVFASAVILLYQSGFIHEKLRALAEQRLGEYSGRDVRIESLTGSLISDATFKGLVIGHEDDIEKCTCLDVESVTVKYNIIDFLRKKIRLREVVVVRPIVYLGRDSEGHFSLKEVFRPTRPRKGGPSKFSMTIDNIYVKDAYYSMDVNFPITEYEHCYVHSRYSVRRGIHTIEVMDSSCYIPAYDLQVKSFGGRITAGGGNVILQDMYARTDLIDVQVDGLVEYSPKLHYTISTEGSRLEASEIDRMFFGERGVISGDMDVNSTLEGGHGWFRSIGEVSIVDGVLVKYPFESFKFDYLYSDGHLVTENVVIDMEGGHFKGEAELYSGKRVSMYNLHFDGTGVDFAFFNNLYKIHTNLELGVVMAGSGFTKETLNSDIVFDVRGGKVGGVAIDSASGTIGLRDMNCAFENLNISIGGASALIKGNLAFDGSIDLFVDAVDIPVNAITSAFDYEVDRGVAHTLIHLAGDIRSPDVSGTVTLKNVYSDKLGADDVILNVDVVDVVDEPEGEFEFKGWGMNVYGVPLNKLTMKGMVKPKEIIIKGVEGFMPRGFFVNGDIKYSYEDIERKEILLTDFGIYVRGFNILSTDEVGIELLESGIGIRRCELRFLDGVVNIQESYIKGEEVHLELAGGGLSVDALDSLLGTTGMFYGRVERFKLEIGGSLTNPDILFSMKAGGGPFRYMEDADVDIGLHYLSDAVHIDRFDLSGSVGRLKVSGYVPISLRDLIKRERPFYEPMNLKVTSDNLDLRLVNNFTNWVFVDGGSVDADIEVKGMPDMPYFEGDIGVRDGYVVIGKYGAQIRDINGEVKLQGREFIIENETPIKGKMDNGYVTTSGTITLPTSVGMPDFNLHILMSNAVLRGVPMVTGIITADVFLTGTPKRDFALRGKVRVHEGLITYNFSEAGRAGTASKDSMDIELYILGENNIWFRNSSADIELSCDMRLKRKDGIYNITGELNALRGYYYFLRKDFQIERGNVVFEGGGEINPNIDILGFLMIRDREENKEAPVYIQIEGTLKEPEISLYSPDYPNLSQEDIITIVALNMTWDEYRQTGVGELAGSQTREYIERYVEDELARSLRRGTGLDTLRIRTNLISGGEKESIKITVGKYITRKFYVSFTSDFYNTQGQSFTAEYYLGRRFSIISETFSEEGAYKYAFGFRYRLRF